MRILSVASEAYPHLKTGGLADVVGALPEALAAQGVEVTTFLPAYRGLQESKAVKLASIPWAFDRDGGPYLDADGQDWPDNFARFCAFGRAAAETAMHMGVDLVHVHDWQAAPTILYLDQLSLVHGLRRPKTVLTIHNLAFQGQAGFLQPGTPEREALQLFDLYFGSDWLEFYGHHNLLKAGILHADAITTVSPTYAQEILTPAFGQGLQDILTYRQDVLSGILNGLDRDQWNPQSDTALTARYSSRTVKSGKAKNKASLQAMCGLEQGGAPLLGLVSRLSDQKGIDLILGALPAWLQAGGQFVALGSGDPELERALRALEKDWPQQVSVQIGYSEDAAHQIHAACDFFLVPSRFEPCGLTQMSAQRYGTLPLVTSVGGLADTVIDGEDGLVLSDVSEAALAQTLRRALHLFGKPKDLMKLRRAAMARETGWAKPAAAYARLYSDLIATAT